MHLLRLTAVVAGFTGSAVVAPLSAQQLEERPVPSHNIVSFSFRSPSMGVPFAVNVGPPRSYQPGSTRKYPALIVTLGDRAFPLALYPARELMSQRSIEEIFVISIGSALTEGDESDQRPVQELHRPSQAHPPMTQLSQMFSLEAESRGIVRAAARS